MNARPTTLKEANAFVGELHRHHDEVVGHRFSFGAEVGSKLVGVVIVGRPVAPKTSQYEIAEVTRLCTDGTQNACSFSIWRRREGLQDYGIYSYSGFHLAD